MSAVFSDTNSSRSTCSLIFILEFAELTKCAVPPQWKSSDSRSIIGKFGPILTLKSIKLEEKESYFMSNAEEWNYILGDMELF